MPGQRVGVTPRVKTNKKVYTNHFFTGLPVSGGNAF